MPHIQKEIIIKNKQGLHARPAAMLVQIVSKFNATVNLEKDGQKVNGRSIMGILTLGAQKDSNLLIEADGDDAQDVVNEIEKLLTQESF
ncbi:MAG: HPr family phosphocarrier protein [Candidatus Omnitrophica bacterium]|nr:HPr family phosphocarrier protein [Candidatus Omnitrophota bacterium]